MSTMKLKLLAAAAIFLGGTLIAWRVAWATPGQGLTITPLSGPATLGPINTKSETDGHEIEIRSTGSSDVFVARIQIAPGGRGGWHSHPGPSIISVVAGTATFYQGDDPNTPHVYVAGAGFVEDADVVHDVRNEGDGPLELIVLQIVPPGAPRRIDQPKPAGASM